MRKLVVILVVCLTAACAASRKVDNDPLAAISRADLEKGSLLIGESDCLTCHFTNEDRSTVGPSYMSIARKYRATAKNIDMLAKRIISGGAGHWGDVPMTPHDDLSLDHAITMVKYVLSVKKADQ